MSLGEHHAAIFDDCRERRDVVGIANHLAQFTLLRKIHFQSARTACGECRTREL